MLEISAQPADPTDDGGHAPPDIALLDEIQGRLLWQPGPSGRHIALGISEMNLFMLLGQLGLSAELCGQLLLRSARSTILSSAADSTR